MSTFKKCKVIMLSSKKKADFGLLFEINKLHKYNTKNDNPQDLLDNLAIPQHLYFLSDDEIKEGDWVYRRKDSYEKIIATTDSSLKLDIPKLGKSENSDFAYYPSLPEPSKEFIEKFIKEYNKDNIITEVMVEYDDYFEENNEEYIHSSGAKGNYYTHCHEVKVNPKDNTITIRKVKDSWNREEVIELLHKRMRHHLGIEYDHLTTINWVNKNL